MSLFSAISRVFLSDWRLTLSSLLIAVVLWAVADHLEDSQNLTTDEFWPVPIKYVNPPPNWRISRDENQDARVRIRGPRNLVPTKIRGRVAVEVDFEALFQDRADHNLRKGINRIPLDTQMVKFESVPEEHQRELSVIPGSLYPAELIIEATRVDKRVPVLLKLVDAPAAGLIVSASRVVTSLEDDSNSVLITGAPQILGRIEHIATKPLDLVADAVMPGDSFQIVSSQDLDLPSDVEIASYDTFPLRAEVTLTEVQEQVTLSSLPVSFELADPESNPDVLLQATPEKVDLLLQVPARRITEFSATSCRVVATVTSVADLPSQIRLDAQLPEGAQLLACTPQVCQVNAMTVAPVPPAPEEVPDSGEE